MLDEFGILIYLDDAIIKSLNSIQGSSYGYIDIRTKKKVWDVGISERNHKENKGTFYLEERNAKDKREGFKGYNNSDVETKTVFDGCDLTTEQRGNTRCEESVTEIYTAYVYHLDFCKNLMGSGKLKEYCVGNNCSNGDYIILKGTLMENTTISYIDSILLIINAYGEEVLDAFIPSEEFLNTKKIKIILETIKIKLEGDGILDLLIDHNLGAGILQINTKYFFNSNSCSSINTGCVVNIVGKVVKKAQTDEEISLLRKLNQSDFYEKLLEKINLIFMNVNIGIPIPILTNIRLNNSIQIIPVSIFI